ncbi:MAG: hypothetical protein ACLPF1_08440 [Methanoregula sp.]|uniref:hypothetical protein n=1 Tax=Methanoregula sp. TaxID=2052170 RepID=UPI003C5212D2
MYTDWENVPHREAMHDSGDTLNLNVKIISIYILETVFLTHRNKRIILSSLSPEPLINPNAAYLYLSTYPFVEQIVYNTILYGRKNIL